MSSSADNQIAPSFLAAGGELGELIRGFDWRTTPLGPPEEWPQGLRTAVRIILTSMQPIWIGWGPELTYLYNDPYKAIIGGKHPRMLGQPTRVVWSEIWDTIGPMLAQALGGDRGTYVESQLLIMERNGYPEETYYTFSYSPIPDDSGRPGGIICANTEDTQRVIGARQLALLRELAARTVRATTWREACSLSAEAVGSDNADLPFSLIYVSEGAGEWVLAAASGIDTGHAAAPARLDSTAGAAWPLAHASIGTIPTVLDDLHARFPEGLPSGVWPTPPSRAAVVAPGASMSSGLDLRLVVGLNPFRALDEDYAGFLTLVAGQVAASMERAHAYEQEQQRVEALAQLDRAKTAFFSNVSHEFRTPLTLMLGPIEELLERSHTDLAPAARERLQIASRNGGRLLRLVNNLLDFSRIEAGRVRAVYEPTDLAGHTAELASVFRAATERAGLDLLVECAPLPEPVYVDRDMWEKVVLNLVSNAFKFTFDGSIAIRLDAVDGHARLQVSDTGSGIASEELPRLFERFHRVENARARTHEGSGIGLALVQELVKLHGGTITAESTAGQGTTFTVTVPRGHAHLPPAQIVTARDGRRPGAGDSFLEEALSWLPGAEALPPADVATSTAAGDGEVAASGPEGAPLVLVADDNADMRGYVGRLLSERYRVTTAENGEEALLAAREEQPDLVLSDVMMPGMDGFELTRAIRQDAALRELPVILLSARAGEEATVEGLAQGADDYLVKPFGARELLARVGGHLQLAQVRKQANEAIREREARLADDLNDTQLLQSVSDQLIAEEDSQALFERLVDAARQIMRADFSSMQVFEGPGAGGLRLLAHRGFDAEAAAGWAWVVPGHETSCGLAARTGRRVVLSDITADLSEGSPAREEYLRAGIRAVQTTPLYARTGRLVGMLSTHWAEPHEPSPRELRFMDILARQAADLLERNSNLEQLRARQAEFETLLDRAPLGVYLIDADFRVAEANPIAVPTFGDVPGGPIGHHFEELLRAVWPAEYADQVMATFAHTLQTGEPFLLPERAERRIDTGEVEYYEWRIERITLPDGRFGLVCYFKDISTQVSAREAIAASEERYRTLVSVITDVPWVTDNAGAFATPQDAWERYTGQSFEEHRGFGWLDAIHPDDREPTGAAWGEAVRTGALYEVQARMWHAPTGAYRHVEARAAPIKDDDGTICEWVGSSTDVEERIAAEERARAASRFKDQLLGMVSHEFRTPLTAIIGNIGALGRLQDLPEDARAAVLADLRTESHRLRRLIENMLLIAQRDRSDAVELEPIALRPLLSAITATVQKQDTSRELVLEVEPGLPPVLGNAGYIEQLVENLVTNSRKYGAKGTRIRIAAVSDGGAARVSVSDEGDRLDPEEVARYFEPFYREARSAGRAQGSGLGLAVCSQLVELMGGTISAQAVPTGGLAVTFTLPVLGD